MVAFAWSRLHNDNISHFMSRSRRSTLSRAWLILPTIVLCLGIPILFFRSAPFERVHGWVTSEAKPEPAIPAPEPELPKFYEWNTRSSFNPVRQDDPSNKTTEQLCDAFPTHLLDEIQPVMKTGHGVIDSRVRLQLHSVSACLTNLLIFSDVDEQFEGHDIIDVVADNPPHLTWNSTQLEAYRNGTLASGEASRKQGWQTDKFKFLPAVSRAWRMRPNRRWYVFYEADTYIVWDNVFRLLENFDPDFPHYFGSPSPRADIWFGNGGPGYVLSREAMRRLVKEDWDTETGEYLGSKLAERYWHDLMFDCCGDSVLGYALHQHNVTLSGLFPMFTVYSPHTIPFGDHHWCQPVLTMHKPSEEDLMGQWHWQWQRRDIRRPLLYRDLATTYFHFPNLTTTADDWTNAHRSDFKAPSPAAHASPPACAAACKAHPQCLQWHHHLRTCHFGRAFKWGRPAEPAEARKFQPQGKDKEGVDKEGEVDWVPGEEDLRTFSGWDGEGIRRWMGERECGVVEWVRPSIERRF